MLFLRYFDYRKLQKLALPIFIGSCALVALTFIPGIAHRAGGASRWIRLGAFTIQPVEFAKLALIIMMAAGFAKKSWNRFEWKSGFLQHLLAPAMLATLCVLQPDFGSTALVICTTGILLYVAGVRWQYLLSVVAVVLPLLTAVMVMAPYRRARLLTYLNPWADPQGAGFQIIQSFLAFHRGGLFGVGLGNSRAKVFYLPEAHNDFILSVVGEELGFLGILLLSLAFLFLIFRAVRVAAKATDSFGALLATGLTVLLGLEVFWNASIVLGLLPTKGMNLPFISSGGSSILCAMAVIGILLNISAQSRAELQEQ
jgi:cell division protein FtsW